MKRERFFIIILQHIIAALDLSGPGVQAFSSQVGFTGKMRTITNVYRRPHRFTGKKGIYGKGVTMLPRG